jgi:hypothetical protein
VLSLGQAAIAAVKVTLPRVSVISATLLRLPVVMVAAMIIHEPALEVWGSRATVTRMALS